MITTIILACVMDLKTLTVYEARIPIQEKLRTELIYEEGNVIKLKLCKAALNHDAILAWIK